MNYVIPSKELLPSCQELIQKLQLQIGIHNKYSTHFFPFFLFVTFHITHTSLTHSSLTVKW